MGRRLRRPQVGGVWVEMGAERGGFPGAPRPRWTAGRGWAPTYLPAHDGHLPPCYLVYAFQLAFSLIDQTGDVLHGLVRCLYVPVIAAK